MKLNNLFLISLFLLLAQTNAFCQKKVTQNLDISWSNVSEQIVHQTNSIIGLIDTIAIISHDTIALNEERINMQVFKTFISNISKIDKDTLGIVNQKLHTLRLIQGKIFILLENQHLANHKSIKPLCAEICGNVNRLDMQKSYFNEACQYNKTGFYFKDDYNSLPPVERQ